MKDEISDKQIMIAIILVVICFSIQTYNLSRTHYHSSSYGGCSGTLEFVGEGFDGTWICIPEDYPGEYHRHERPGNSGLLTSEPVTNQENHNEPK